MQTISSDNEHCPDLQLQPGHTRRTHALEKFIGDYLVANHVLPSHWMVAVGRASSNPLASNETAEGHPLNRRIDVIIDTRRILLIGAKAATSPE